MNKRMVSWIMGVFAVALIWWALHSIHLGEFIRKLHGQ
jgi:uncharacterized membrane protein YwzB